MKRVRRGFALLEVLVALAILTATGAAVIAAASESIGAVRRAHESSRDLQQASAFMDAVTLWTRTELDQRLGVRRQGTWWLRIERPLPSLYTVELLDTGKRRIIGTSLYRSRPDDSP